MSVELRESVIAALREVQIETMNVGIKAVESLHADKQGLTLDDATISACVRILRNLRDGRTRQIEARRTLPSDQEPTMNNKDTPDAQ